MNGQTKSGIYIGENIIWPWQKVLTQITMWMNLCQSSKESVMKVYILYDSIHKNLARTESSIVTWGRLAVVLSWVGELGWKGIQANGSRVMKRVQLNIWDSSISKPYHNKRLQSSHSQPDHHQAGFEGLYLYCSDAFSLRLAFSKSFHRNTKASPHPQKIHLSFLLHSVLLFPDMIQAVGFLMMGSVRSNG